MILMIDNYDSFTFNVYQQVAGLGHRVRVFPNDGISVRGIQALRPSHIIISPGPGRPAAGGVSLEAIRRLHRHVPILGICLGHQCIGEAFGSRIVRLRRPWHGKTSPIRHEGTGLFRGVPKRFQVARYHSLALDRVPKGFSLSADTADRTIMGIRHRSLPLYGVQFHPESFLTRSGDKIIRNFLR